MAIEITTTTTTRTLTLPDLPAYWPFKSAPVLPLEEIVAESNAWVANYSPFHPKAQAAFFKCKFGSCAWLVYPRITDRAHLRAAVDLMSLYYVIDLYTDEEDAHTASERCDMVMDAFRYVTAASTFNMIYLTHVRTQKPAW